MMEIVPLSRDMGTIKINGRMVAGFSIDSCTGHAHIMSSTTSNEWRGDTLQEAIDTMLAEMSTWPSRLA